MVDESERIWWATCTPPPPDDDPVPGGVAWTKWRQDLMAAVVDQLDRDAETRPDPTTRIWQFGSFLPSPGCDPDDNTILALTTIRANPNNETST